MNPNLKSAVWATFAIFGLNGLVFASWAARIPAASAALELSSGQMGALLLVGAVGSVLSLPLAGLISARVGTANTVRVGGAAAALAAATVAAGLQFQSVPLTGGGLFLFGSGVALWDVAQNIEGADVERRLRRTIMPRFHAAFSGGAFLGALLGAGLAAIDAFEGTVLAVTHDRWFARSLDRFLIFGEDGVVFESPTPVWDQAPRPRR